MPLLLLDLDNTLIDRTAAFRRWAAQLVADLGRPPDDVDVVMKLDNDGYTPRDQFTREAADHLGAEPAELLAAWGDGLAKHVILESDVVQALTEAKGAGWTPVIVTNGLVRTQTNKLKHTGLDNQVASYVISEAAGVAKPDRRIFEIAAEQAGVALDGGWMIGDNATADIGGAHNAGLNSIWLHRGREWSIADFTPTQISATCHEAIRAVIKA